MPKVSVIIPVYNVEKYLRECLDSVINQTLKDIEIICINDGSTDGSLAILEEYAAKDNRIKIIDLKENIGVGKARNIAFKEVTAPYVMYLDSDDWYELNACNTAYNQISANNNDMVIFDVYRYLGAKNKKNMQDCKKLKKYAGYKNINYKDLDKPYSFLAPCFKIYSKNFLKENNISFEEVYYYEDMQFFYQLIYANPNFSVIFEPLYNYRKRNDSITNTSSTFHKEIEVRNRLLEFCINNENAKFLKFFIISYINTIYLKYTKFSKKNIGFRCFNYNKIRKCFVILNDIVPFGEIEDEIKKYKDIVFIKDNNIFFYLFRTFIKYIFSIKNSKDKAHKIITILGIKIKLKRNKYNG